MPRVSAFQRHARKRRKGEVGNQEGNSPRTDRALRPECIYGRRRANDISGCVGWFGLCGCVLCGSVAGRGEPVRGSGRRRQHPWTAAGTGQAPPQAGSSDVQASMKSRQSAWGAGRRGRGRGVDGGLSRARALGRSPCRGPQVVFGIEGAGSWGAGPNWGQTASRRERGAGVAAVSPVGVVRSCPSPALSMSPSAGATARRSQRSRTDDQTRRQEPSS